MKQSRFAWILGLALIGIGSLPAFAQEKLPSESRVTEEYEIRSFQVPKDETLPVDELSLLLDPLTKEDLEQEVRMWLGLLQDNLRTISEVQITMKYLNKDLQVFQDAQNSLTGYQEAFDAQAAGKAAAATDTSATIDEQIRVLDQALLEARFNISAAVEKALAREAKAFEVHNLGIIVEAALESFSKRGESHDFQEFDTAERGLADLRDEIVNSDEGYDPTSPEQMKRINQDLEEILRKKLGVRDLVEAYLAHLLDDRGSLVDRTRMVLSEWEHKGASQEELAPYTFFIDEVTSFQLDVADNSTRWSLIQLWLKSEAGGKKVAKKIGVFCVLMAGFYTLSWLVGLITRKALYRTKNISHLMRDFIIRSIRRVVFLVGFMMSLSLLGVNIAPLLGVVGAASFIIAFALQTTLGNFASGIMIMIYKPFDVGDAIDAAGVMGVVKTMNLTSTIVNTFDNKLVIIPNNTIWGNVITNITGSKTRRVDLVFRISYGDDPSTAEQIIHEVLGEQELILADPEPLVKMHELSDFTVNFICRPWVKTEDYWNVRWLLTEQIKERFAKAGFAPPVDPGAFIKRVSGP